MAKIQGESGNSYFVVTDIIAKYVVYIGLPSKLIPQRGPLPERLHEEFL
jgi:hypothetical protein